MHVMQPIRKSKPDIHARTAEPSSPAVGRREEERLTPEGAGEEDRGKGSVGGCCGVCWCCSVASSSWSEKEDEEEESQFPPV